LLAASSPFLTKLGRAFSRRTFRWRRLAAKLKPVIDPDRCDDGERDQPGADPQPRFWDPDVAHDALAEFLVVASH
jgi:hypothetical protein